MFNFYSLSPGEFGELSRDVLEIMTGKRLYVTDSPNDRGIDIADDRLHPSLIGQAKHYIGSTSSQLMQSLKRERENLERIRPKEYFLFVSKELTADRLDEIVELFRPIVPIEVHNVVTLHVLDDMLRSPEYRPVLQKYPTLWNFSTDILKDVVNRSVLLDSEEIIQQANEHTEFVPTEVFGRCLETLEREHILLLQGAPGSGKTITSKMIALDFIHRGYSLRYSADSNIKELKEALSLEDDKGLLFLDDFLGQIYYNMDESKIRQLETVLSYVRRSKNKYIILNSRVTILREAYQKFNRFSPLLRNIPVVSTDSLTTYEKAQIFKNHIEKNFPDALEEHVRYLVSTEKHLEIIRHRNFNPRIISLLSLLRSHSAQPDVCYQKLIHYLNFPEEIWKEEFETRLLPQDRVLLTTLYSLTNRSVEYDILRECFNARIGTMPEIDKTVNQLNSVLNRLNQSMIQVSIKEKYEIGVINPSVNDFLFRYIEENKPEKEAVIHAAVYLDQILKIAAYFGILGPHKEFAPLFEQKINDGSLLKLKTIESGTLGNILVWHCIMQKLRLDERYRESILQAIRSGKVSAFSPYRIDSSASYLLPLFEEPLFSFYELDRWLTDGEFVQGMLQCCHDEWDCFRQVTNKIWAFLQQKNKDVDIELFRRMFLHEFEELIYQKFLDVDRFVASHYDVSSFYSQTRMDISLWSYDDIIDYCETDLAYELERDIWSRYCDFSKNWADEHSWELDYLGEYEFELNEDVLSIDQNIGQCVENILDNVLSDLLPESVYDEYVGRNREASYDLSLNQMYVAPSETRKTLEQINRLFSVE